MTNKRPLITTPITIKLDEGAEITSEYNITTKSHTAVCPLCSRAIRLPGSGNVTSFIQHYTACKNRWEKHQIKNNAVTKFIGVEFSSGKPRISRHYHGHLPTEPPASSSRISQPIFSMDRSTGSPYIPPPPGYLNNSKTYHTNDRFRHCNVKKFLETKEQVSQRNESGLNKAPEGWKHNYMMTSSGFYNANVVQYPNPIGTGSYIFSPPPPSIYLPSVQTRKKPRTVPSESSLPDEIILEILKPALQVPDEAFSHIGDISPFFNSRQSTSAYLLVNKRWCNVATPLLYNVVILRSSAQMLALEIALQRNPEFGRFIKKMRIEGGYCPSLYEILKATKNLKDLYLSLAITSKDLVFGVCKGFSFIQPERLIIYDHLGTKRNSQNLKLNASLEIFIQEKWEKLKIIVLPVKTLTNLWRECWVNMVTGRKLNTIESVTVDTEFYCGTEQWLLKLSEIPSIREIILAGYYWDDRFLASFETNITNNPRLQKLCKCKPYTWKSKEIMTSEGQDLNSLPPTVNHQSRNWVIELSDEIWTNIFSHVFGLPALENPEWRCTRADAAQNKFGDCFGLVQICRKLRKIAYPLYWECIVLHDEKDYSMLENLLSREGCIGKMIKSIFTIDASYDPGYKTRAINKILEYTPNLQRIAVNRITNDSRTSKDILDWRSLYNLSRHAKPSLRDVAIHLHQDPPQTTPLQSLYAFNGLRNLEFHTDEIELSCDLQEIDRTSLPRLESIVLSSDTNDLFSLISYLDLPNLRKARFPNLEKSIGAITFIRKHGHKLRLLEVGFIPGISIFDSCPNLLVFEVPRENIGLPMADFFSSTYIHPLKTLHIKTISHIQTNKSEKARFQYIDALDLTTFTALDKVVIDACNWPRNDDELSKSHWVVWAERLQQKCNVKMADARGRCWIPRLRTK